MYYVPAAGRIHNRPVVGKLEEQEMKTPSYCWYIKTHRFSNPATDDKFYASSFRIGGLSYFAPRRHKRKSDAVVRAKAIQERFNRLVDWHKEKDEKEQEDD